MIDPQTVENIKFKTHRFTEGYDQDEVDNFLDQVALDLRSVLDSNGHLEAERSRLKARCDALQRALDARDEARTVPVPVVAQDSSGDAASRLLDHAQRTADAVLADASSEAQKVIERANATAQEIIGSATTDADARRAAAEEAARAAEEKLAAIAEIRAQTKQHVESVLAELRDRIGE